jgi:hypothetical protein
MLTALVLAAEKSTAEEGRDIIIGMLLTGLVFVAVIAIGELGRWFRRRRGAAH